MKIIISPAKQMQVDTEAFACTAASYEHAGIAKAVGLQ